MFHVILFLLFATASVCIGVIVYSDGFDNGYQKGFRDTMILNDAKKWMNDHDGQ